LNEDPIPAGELPFSIQGSLTTLALHFESAQILCLVLTERPEPIP
jgi:hypothetical protein